MALTGVSVRKADSAAPLNIIELNLYSVHYLCINQFSASPGESTVPPTLRTTWTWATQREATASARCLGGHRVPCSDLLPQTLCLPAPRRCMWSLGLSQLCSALVLSAGLKPKVCHLPCLHLPAITPLHTTRELSPANHRGPLCLHVQ